MAILKFLSFLGCNPFDQSQQNCKYCFNKRNLCLNAMFNYWHRWMCFSEFVVSFTWNNKSCEFLRNGIEPDVKNWNGWGAVVIIHLRSLQTVSESQRYFGLERTSLLRWWLIHGVANQPEWTRSIVGHFIWLRFWSYSPWNLNSWLTPEENNRTPYIALRVLWNKDKWLILW